MGLAEQQQLARIVRVVAEHFKVEPEVLIAPHGTMRSSTKQYHEPRRIAMLFARETGTSFPEIGRFFKRDHSTVILACRTAAEEAPPEMLMEIRDKLRGVGLPAADCPSCRQLKLELMMLKAELLEFRARMGCG